MLLLSLDTKWASRNNHLRRFTSTNTIMTLSVLYLHLHVWILYVAFWVNWSNPSNDRQKKGVTWLVKIVLPVSKQINEIGCDVCCDVAAMLRYLLRCCDVCWCKVAVYITIISIIMTTLRLLLWLLRLL